MTDRATSHCQWCERAFQSAKVGPHQKRFCSATCKQQFHTAAMRYAERLVHEGFITVDDLKHHSRR